jgi:hypothetical protein
MAAHSAQPDPTVAAGAPVASYEERLERCEIVHFPVCPVPLPEGGDRRFLLEQKLASSAHKNISYDPHSGRANGFKRRDDAQAERLRELLAAFSRNTTSWVADHLPHHARAWRLDRVSYRPDEEATRQLRQTARNDLLHVDAFPSRPTQGHRILRFFVNINPTEPRMWVTSDPFPQLLEKYGRTVGLPSANGLGWSWRLKEGLVRLFQPNRPRRTVYDAFMLRFHDFLKANDDFQEHCAKHYWPFAPGSAWMVFTDAVSHAVLRGRYALEHSYFVAPEGLVLPELSPSAVLQKACGAPVLNAA